MNNVTQVKLCLVAVALAVLSGCGTLAATPVLVVSVTTSVLGGMANGGVMGGSTIGVIHNAMVVDEDPLAAEQPDQKPLPVSVASVAGKAPSGLERACYFPNASGRGMPCS